MPFSKNLEPRTSAVPKFLTFRSPKTCDGSDFSQITSRNATGLQIFSKFLPANLRGPKCGIFV